MTENDYFCDDNTDGYSSTQLDELNARLETAVTAAGLDDDPSSTDADEVQALGERILTDYDTELAAE